MMSPIRSHSLAGLALIVLTAGGCVTAAASPSANPLASATVPPPVRLQFVDDLGFTRTFTVDIDDQSGLLVEATDGKASSAEDPGAITYEGNYGYVFLSNDASDDSVLRVVWAAGGGCAASYAMTIDPTARKLRIEGPPAAGDSVGGDCGVTLRFSEPVLAAEIEGVLADPG